jgi:hypothetical protein
VKVEFAVVELCPDAALHLEDAEKAGVSALLQGGYGLSE